MVNTLIEEYYNSLQSLSEEYPDLFKKTSQRVYFKETLKRNYYDPYIQSKPVTIMLPQTSFTIVGEGWGDRTTGWFIHANNKLDKTLQYDEKVLQKISTIIDYENHLAYFKSYNADPYIMLWLMFWGLDFSITYNDKESMAKELERIASSKTTLEEKIAELYTLNIEAGKNVSFWGNSFINFDKSTNQLAPFPIETEINSEENTILPSSYSKRLWTENYTLECDICKIKGESLHSLKPEMAVMSYFMCEKCLNKYYNYNSKTVSLLAAQENIESRIKASSSLFATADVLKTLAFDSEHQVRDNVLSNPNSDNETKLAVSIQKAI